MRKASILLIVVLALIFGACKKEKAKVELIEGWFPWTGYIGGLYAMNKTDSLYNLDFKIVDGADNINPVQLVLADKYKFGVTGAEAIIAANINTGADLVAIGVVNYKSATCFLSLPESSILKIQDFQGKVIGILSGTETETIYKALKKKFKLQIDSIKNEVEAPYDLQTFLLKKYDVRPGFTYDEAVTLDMKGIKYNILYPEDYGISTLGGVYFTRRKTIKENPELVQKVVNSIAMGWELALENPEEGVILLKQHDPANIDIKREDACFKKGLEYFKGENDSVLYASDKSWKNFENVLKSIDRVPSSFDIKSSYDNSFIINYFKSKNEGK